MRNIIRKAIACVVVFSFIVSNTAYAFDGTNHTLRSAASANTQTGNELSNILPGQLDAIDVEQMKSSSAGISKEINKQISRLNSIFKGRRHDAAKALGEIGDPSAVPALITALGDSIPYVRYQAIMALRKIGDPLAVPALILVMEKGNAPEDVIDVIELIGRIADSSMIPALIEMCKNGYMHKAIIEALIRLGGKHSKKITLLHKELQREESVLEYTKEKLDFLESDDDSGFVPGQSTHGYSPHGDPYEKAMHIAHNRFLKDQMSQGRDLISYAGDIVSSSRRIRELKLDIVSSAEQMEEKLKQESLLMSIKSSSAGTSLTDRDIEHINLAAEIANLSNAKGTIVYNDTSLSLKQQKMFQNLIGTGTPGLAELEAKLGCNVRLMSQGNIADNASTMIISTEKLDNFKNTKYFITQQQQIDTSYVAIAPLIAIAKGLLGLENITEQPKLYTALKNSIRSLSQGMLNERDIEEAITAYINGNPMFIKLPLPISYDYDQLEQLQRQALKVLIDA